MVSKQVKIAVGVVGILAVIALAVTIAALVIVKQNNDKKDDEKSPEASSSTARAGSTTAQPHTGTYPDTTPSTEQDYREAAEFFKKSMNTSVDPCDNFFEYMCGNWIADHPIPTGAKQESIAEQMQEAGLNAVRDGISKITDTSMRAMNILKNVYDICIEDQSAEHDVEALSRVFNWYEGFPLIDHHATVPDQLEKTLADIQRTSESMSFMWPSIDPDLGGNVSERKIYLSQGQPLLPSLDYYTGTAEQRSEGMHVMTQLVLGVYELFTSITETTSQQGAMDAVALAFKIHTFESKVMKAFEVSRRGKETDLYNRFTLKQLEARWPDWNWQAYLNNLLTTPIYIREFQETDSFLVVQHPKFLDALNDALHDGEFKPMDIQNYFMLHLYATMLPLTAAQHQNRFLFLTKEQAIPQRSDFCLDVMIQRLPFGMGRIAVDQVGFDSSHRKRVDDMVQEIVLAMTDNFGSAKWLDDDTRAGAIKKLQNIDRNTGYPDWIMDNKALDKFYSDLNPNTTSSAFEAYIGVISWHIDKQLADLLKPTDRTDFDMSPALLNAWYQPQLNSITIPVAILQKPVFRLHGPMYVNFGSIGIVMGHEITHGFDDEGVQFDYDGSLHNWMTNASAYRFREMADCIVNEFDQFCYPELGLCLNGYNNQGENIADGGGTRMAYKAWKQWVDKHGADEKLPGFESFSADQLFFMSASIFWCGSYDPEFLKVVIQTNPHSPPRNRVLGTMRNMDEFSAAFKCKDKTFMNPPQDEKCYVWVDEPENDERGTKEALAYFQSNQNDTAMACDSFYEHVCGNYATVHPLPADRPRLAVFDLVSDRALDTVVDALDDYEDIDCTSEGKDEALCTAGSTFLACAGDTADATDAILKKIKELGGWPILGGTWDSKDFNAGKLAGMLAGEHDVKTFLDIGPDTDLTNPSEFILTVLPGSLGLPSKAYYVDPAYNDTIAKYTELIVEVASHLGSTAKDMTAEAKAIVEFEKSFAEIFADEEPRDISLQLNVGSLGSLEKTDPNFYKTYLTALLPKDIAFLVLRDETRVNVNEPTFMFKLRRLLSSGEHDDKTIANYLVWRFVYAHREFLNMNNIFNNFVLAAPDTSRNRSCAAVIRDYLPWATGRLYIEKAGFTDRNKDDVENIVTNVLNAFSRHLQNITWMDSDTLREAQLKVKNLVLNIAYPSWILEDDKLNAEYADFHVTEDESFFEISHRLRSRHVQRNMDKLRPAVLVDRTDFGRSPAVVNAWYSPDKNSVTIPAAILSEPFYKHSWPVETRYGAIGAVIGHELTHAFDDEGVQFDYQGLLRTWMTTDARAGFHDMAECVVKQYGSYFFPDLPGGGMHVNGIQTQGENIADNGGIKAALTALSMDSHYHSSPAALQNFYTAFGNFYCEIQTKESLIKQLLVDPHSPHKVRVDLALKNAEAFSQAFACKDGDAMKYDGKSCSVW